MVEDIGQRNSIRAMLLAQIAGGATPDHLGAHGDLLVADPEAENDLVRQHAQFFDRVVIEPNYRADVGAALAGVAALVAAATDLGGIADLNAGQLLELGK